MKRKCLIILLAMVSMVCCAVMFAACNGCNPDSNNNSEINQQGGSGGSEQEGTQHTHDWGEWQIKKYATCSSTGEEERICKLDSSHKETREIAINPTAHSLNEGENNCSGCGTKLTGGLHYVITDNGYSVSRGSVDDVNIILPTIYNNLPVIYIANQAFYCFENLESIIIPDSVTSIGLSAFFGCPNLTNITIPDSVTSIGDSAFYSCYGLSSISIPCSVTTIGSSAFEECIGLTSVIIAEGVTEIDSSAFANCIGLSSIIIPDSVTAIGRSIFSGCTSLADIKLSENITYIGYSAFAGTALKNVTIPEKVTRIDDRAFQYCSCLSSIVIPDSVTSIGEYAFYDCYNLKSVTMGSGVKSIEFDAFSQCQHLNAIYIKDIIAWCNIDYFGSTGASYLFDYNLYLNNQLVTNLEIPQGVTEIKDKTFTHCVSLNSIIFPSSLTSIGYQAFLDCSNLANIKIPDSVTYIGELAFIGTAYYDDAKNYDSCGVLYIGHHLIKAKGTISGNYEIKAGTKTIAPFAFGYLDSITIPSSVTHICSQAFYGTRSINKVNITDLAAWCNIDIDGSWATNPLYLSHDLYLNDNLITNLVIPNGVKEIKSLTFENCESITSVVIPDSVTSIGEGAFAGCSKLKTVTLGNGVKSIGYHAFYGCGNIEDITIPNNVTFIGEEAFYNCAKLAKVVISDSVTSIEEDAFRNCQNLKGVYIDNLESWCNIVFGSSYANPLYYAHNLYLNNNLLTNLEMPQGIVKINNNAFVGCTSIEGVYITDLKDWCEIEFGGSTANPLYYGHNLYLNNNLVTNLEIPNGVTEIKSNAFVSCTSFTKIIIPESVKKIDEKAFYDCSNVANLVIPDGIDINSSAFSNTSFYKNTENRDDYGVLYIGKCLIKANNTISGIYEIKDGTTTIAPSAFYNCRNLTGVTMPDSVVSIGDDAFSGCYNLLSISIGSNVTYLGEDAFMNCLNLESIEVDENNPYYSSNSGILYNKAKTEFIMIPDAIKGEVIIPNTITQIDKIFAGCKNIEKIVLPDNITYIADEAFSGCTNLVTITIPEGIISIGYEAFSNCENLININIPSSVNSIGNWAFENCKSLVSINIPSSLTKLSELLFYGCESLKEVIIPDSIVVIEERAFFGCKNLKNIIIPDSVTYISNEAFEGCTSITDIVIPNSVVYIGSSAFRDCVSLANISIPNKVVYLGAHVFDNTAYYNTDSNWDSYGVLYLNNMLIQAKETLSGDYEIKAGTITIAPSAFYNCDELTGLTIPASVVLIGKRAFESCSNLRNAVALEGINEWTAFSGPDSYLNYHKWFIYEKKTDPAVSVDGYYEYYLKRA